MKQVIKRLLVIVCAILLVMSSVTTAFAHSGRTDSNGGHKDNKNKSGLGGYHYHCGGYPAHLHVSGYCPYRDVFPSNVTIKSNKTTLGIGESISISAAVYPNNSCDKSVTWTCSDTSVVSLSNGTITAKNYGTAIITAKTFNNVKGTIKITVKEITAKKVTLLGIPEVSDFYIGDSFDLDATITPENVDNPSIVWSSSNEEIATVSSSGYVNIISAGKVVIKAIASNGVSGKVVINAKEKYVDSVEIAEDNMDIFLGDIRNIIAIVSPSDATHPEITWSTDNPSVINVSETGKIIATALGEATITATSTNGISDSIVIIVNEIKAEKLTILAPERIDVGSSKILTAEFTPNNTTNQHVVWSVDNTSIASISEDGFFEAKKVGTVMVTATQKDVSSTYIIEILPINVDDIIITASTEETIYKEDTIDFTAEVFPIDATYPEITWSVDNPEIASIDNNGKLTALKAGTVTVIATSADGFCSEYEVTVSYPVAVVLGICAAVLGGTGTAIFVAIKKIIGLIKSKFK